MSRKAHLAYAGFTCLVANSSCIADTFVNYRENLISDPGETLSMHTGVALGSYLGIYSGFRFLDYISKLVKSKKE